MPAELLDRQDRHKLLMSWLREEGQGGCDGALLLQRDFGLALGDVDAAGSTTCRGRTGHGLRSWRTHHWTAPAVGRPTDTGAAGDRLNGAELGGGCRCGLQLGLLEAKAVPQRACAL